MEEICAAKDRELTNLLQNFSRLEAELASVRKVCFLLILLPLPGGIVILCVCWLVRSLLCLFISVSRHTGFLKLESCTIRSAKHVSMLYTAGVTLV